MKLSLVPCSVQDACDYVRQFHRHHGPPLSGLFAVACAAGEAVCGVAIAGRPVARLLQDGWTAEVTRLATDGTKNACSFLYAACWRGARAIGYRRLVTYILATEPGTPLVAAGWRNVGHVVARSWHCQSRPRVDRHPKQDKIRWEVPQTANRDAAMAVSPITALDEYLCADVCALSPEYSVSSAQTPMHVIENTSLCLYGIAYEPEGQVFESPRAHHVKSFRYPQSAGLSRGHFHAAWPFPARTTWIFLPFGWRADKFPSDLSRISSRGSGW